MFDFPSSPAPNDTYTSGGKTYVWDGQKWKQRPNAEGYTAKTANSRNRVINPAMAISQEVGSSGTALSAQYAVDQWTLVFAAGLTGISAARSATTTPDGSPWGCILGFTVAKASLAAADFVSLRQPIEGTQVADFLWGTANAKQVVLRFNFWNGGTAATFGVAVWNNLADRTWVQNFSAPNGWSRQTFVIPGDTTGTWPKDNTRGLTVAVTPVCGTTYVAPAAGWNGATVFAAPGVSNGMATVPISYYLADVGFYLDPDKTGIAPPWEMPSEADELIKCKRYWQQTFTFFSANVTSGGLYYGLGALTVQMRTTPTMTGVNSGVALFPSTVGTLSLMHSTLYEGRSANGSGNGVFDTVVTANART